MVIVVEGDTDVPYVRKLVVDAGIGTIPMPVRGKGNIDRDLAKYNGAARSMPCLVVRDLDHDAPCGGEFVGRLKMKPARWFRLRLAVREVESWILADATGLARFLDVDAKWIPSAPDLEVKPTASLLKVARRSTAYRRRMLPEKGRSAMVGPLYEATLIEFGERAWSVDRAAERSPSLQRARAAVRSLANDWRAYLGDNG
ncbi:MAG: hypothetical protein NVSMB1_02390 [Polyangiales bacterium]